jgi:hypothetical protein
MCQAYKTLRIDPPGEGIQVSFFQENHRGRGILFSRGDITPPLKKNSIATE